MLINAKRKGGRNERRAKKELEMHGYKAMKAGASLGAFDLIAISRHLLLLVQCKSNKWPSPAERKKIEQFDAPFGAIKMLWRYNDRKVKPSLRIWADPFGEWEWIEIDGLPVSVVTPIGAALQFNYAGASLKKALEYQQTELNLPCPAEWPSEI